MLNLQNYCCSTNEEEYLRKELVYMDNNIFFIKKKKEIYEMIMENSNKNFEEIIILTPKLNQLPIKNFIKRFKIYNNFLDNSKFINEFYNLNLDKINDKYRNLDEKLLLNNSLLFLKNKSIIIKEDINNIQYDLDELILFINKQLFFLNNLISYNNSFLLSYNINFLKKFIKVILNEVFILLTNFLNFNDNEFLNIFEIIEKYMSILDTLEFNLFKFDINNEKNNDWYIDTDLLKCLKIYVYNKNENINKKDTNDWEIYILHFIYMFVKKINPNQENYLLYNKLFLQLDLVIIKKNINYELLKYPNFSIIKNNKDIKKNNKFKNRKKSKIDNYSNISLLSTIKETSSIISFSNINY